MPRLPLLLLTLGVTACAQPAPSTEFEVRPFRPFIAGKWIGNAICYGPHRDGQAPGKQSPTTEEMRQDLRIMGKHWSLIRMYGVELTRPVLEIIAEDDLPMRVMVGAWITAESRTIEGKTEVIPGAREANQKQVSGAIALANEYPKQVVAVSVGNETQVFWSDHQTAPEVLLGYVREVRAGTTLPVTVADDFNFWNKPESQQVGREVDFIVTHIHALWAGLPIDRAMEWTDRIYTEIVQHHPRRTVVVGEAGWATRKHVEGDQARLIKGSADEANQARYYRELRDWARRHKITTFNFEAFDENWKGGPHPDEVEKHWGVFRADRTPKPAISGR